MFREVLLTIPNRYVWHRLERLWHWRWLAAILPRRNTRHR